MYAFFTFVLMSTQKEANGEGKRGEAFEALLKTDSTPYLFYLFVSESARILCKFNIYYITN